MRLDSLFATSHSSSRQTTSQRCYTSCILAHSCDHESTRRGFSSCFAKSQNCRVCTACHAHPSLHHLLNMNQYDVDEYVLPRRRSPWVLVGAGGTAAILLGGLLAFRRHEGLQGATVAVMAGTAGAASLATSSEEAPIKPKISKKNAELQ